MGWFYVLLAASAEIVGIIGIKKLTIEKSFKNIFMFVGGFVVAFMFLYHSFQYLDMSIAYAAWTGIATAAAVLVNMVFYGESKSMHRIISLVVIIIGLVGLKAFS